jgi:hypothetical protein
MKVLVVMGALPSSRTQGDHNTGQLVKRKRADAGSLQRPASAEVTPVVAIDRAFL